MTEARRGVSTHLPLRPLLFEWLGRSKPSAAEGPGGRGLPLRWWELAGYAVLLAVALSMRLWDLDARAMHHDESLHAFYSWNLFKGAGYQHNPMMHGPFQFEANAAVFFVFGDSNYTARLLYVAFGTALVGLPFFVRGRLGRLGALLVAGMLAFSPVMLYFSRFARNDILMAVWTLGLVICIWRYMDEGKHRYLYVASALLALAFATKETAFIATATLGLMLALLVAPEVWAEGSRRTDLRGAPTPVALARAVAGAWGALRGVVARSRESRPASFLVLLITLTLPEWSALVSVLQGTPLLSWSNLTLANPEGVYPIGAPSGGGLVLAALVVLVLLGTSVYWGARWRWPVWWRCALVFYSLWVLLYTTFFTNLVGIGSGMWQSLGYWVVQQGEGRGGQPWYYHFLLASIYEFLPLLFSVVAAVYYFRRDDLFGRFLVLWAAATFAFYTLASEKMPWLAVNVTLPLIVLSGKLLADLIGGIQWRRLLSAGGLLLLPGVPVCLLLLWRLAFLEGGGPPAANVLVPLALALPLVPMIAFGVLVSRRAGLGNVAAFSAVPAAAVLLALTMVTGWRASYRNGDIPVEMIVYTQTSPDVVRLVRGIEEAGKVTGQRANVPVSIDQTSGFTWPWAWYLRDYPRADYPSYEGAAPRAAPESAVVLVHSRNNGEAGTVLRGRFSEGERFKHRWWFPENTYRNLTLGKFLRSLADRKAWRRAMDYFLYRKGVREQLGSEDAYAYFSHDLPPGLSGSQRFSEGR